MEPSPHQFLIWDSILQPFKVVTIVISCYLLLQDNDQEPFWQVTLHLHCINEVASDQKLQSPHHLVREGLEI